MKRPVRPARVTVLVVTALVAAACGGSHAVHKAAAASSPTQTPSAASPHVAAVYPLTGYPATNAANARRPALSVKIDNVGDALPQAGLNHADLVTDILVEGGLTRLMATFQSQDASVIGPVRSARPVDADLVRELGGGIFAYSGAAPGEIAPMINHGNALRIVDDGSGRIFYRDYSRPAPHNLMTSTARLYGAARQIDPHLGPPPQLFHYSSAAVAGPLVRWVRLAFSSYSVCGWSWTGSNYVRSQNGAADRLADGSRVNTTNVVILSVTWSPTHIIDAAGNADPYVHVIGSGQAWVMRDGRLIVGHWTRPSYRVPMRLTDASGHVIALRPGRTWLELQPQPFRPQFPA
jgi:hypothetical protein